jgi:hypothetical protein
MSLLRIIVMRDQRLEICYHLRIPPAIGVCMPPMFPHMKMLEVNWRRTCLPKFKLPIIIPSAIMQLLERLCDPGAFFVLNRPWKCFAEGGRGGAWWRWGIDSASILQLPGTCTPTSFSNTTLQVSRDFGLAQLNMQFHSYLK